MPSDLETTENLTRLLNEVNERIRFFRNLRHPVRGYNKVLRDSLEDLKGVIPSKLFNNDGVYRNFLKSLFGLTSFNQPRDIGDVYNAEDLFTKAPIGSGFLMEAGIGLPARGDFYFKRFHETLGLLFYKNLQKVFLCDYDDNKVVFYQIGGSKNEQGVIIGEVIPSLDYLVYSRVNDFLPCDGGSHTIDGVDAEGHSYRDLFDVIGYKYGGSDGTFKVPCISRSMAVMQHNPNSEDDVSIFKKDRLGNVNTNVIPTIGDYKSQNVYSNNFFTLRGLTSDDTSRHWCFGKDTSMPNDRFEIPFAIRYK